MLQKYAILAFLSFVWGTTWIAIKYSLIGIPPFLGASARFLVALACLLGYAAYKRRSLKISSKDFSMIFISSILLYLLDYGLIYWGEQYINAGATAIFFATFPLFTGVVSNFVFRSEAFQWQKFLGLVIGFLGIAIVFYDQLLQTRFEGMVVWASIAVIISALSAAVSLVMVKKYLSHMETVTLTLHQMIWGVVMLGLIGLLGGELPLIKYHPASIIAVVYMGIVASALAFVLYYYLLKEMSAISVSSIIYITPVVAILIGWVMLNESITPQIITGMLVTFVGIFVSQMKEYQKYLSRKTVQKYN